MTDHQIVDSIQKSFKEHHDRIMMRDNETAIREFASEVFLLISQRAPKGWRRSFVG